MGDRVAVASDRAVHKEFKFVTNPTHRRMIRDRARRSSLTPVRLVSIGATVAFLASLLAGPAHAAIYPDKPVRLIVPFAPGGGVDGAARPLALGLAERLGQQVVVDNRGGAGGIIGMELAARAAPDGYTLLMTTAGFTAMPGLHKQLPFDPVQDYAPVIVAVSGVYALAVNTSLPVRSVQELIAYAKANPGKLTFASAGTGSTIHLAGELFKRSAGVELVHVPYKGAGPALTDLIAGQVQMMFGTALNVIPLAKAGKLRALAVTSAKRSTFVPELPTIAESGLRGYEVDGWYGLAAPAKTPRPIIEKLNADTKAALRSPELIERLRSQGLEPVGGTPEQAAALIRNDVARWTRVIREAGIKTE